jgi:hypothetical protein
MRAAPDCRTLFRRLDLPWSTFPLPNCVGDIQEIGSGAEVAAAPAAVEGAAR